MLERIVAIIRREYLERVRTRAFWISTLLVPVFMGAVMVIPAWLAERGGGHFTIAVLDLSGRFADPVHREVAKLLSAGDEKMTIDLVDVETGADPAATRRTVKAAVQAGTYDGMLVLPAGLPEEGQPEYVAPNVAAFKLLSILERAVNKAVIAARLTAAGLDPAKVSDLTRRVDLRTLKLGKKGEETRDQGQGFLLSYAFVLIIYMSVLMYGVYVMRGVLEEKTNRIVEVIVAT
ncbi:MAG TPA: ABC transporter permease, partial [Acidobacteria bacterium]|nr:ABC transporter permease [Acidobacteriota bacterium]